VRPPFVRHPDWLATAWQVLPRAFEVVARLEPTFDLPGAAAVTTAFAREHRVLAVLWDVDGTLMPYHHTSVPRESQAILDDLERGGVRQAILSNCGEARFRELGEVFPQLPVLKAYRMATGEAVLRVLVGSVDRWLTSRPGGPAKPYRKPSATLVRLALDHLGISEPARALMIGDQCLTDVAGANLAGIRSAKVPTLARSTFPPAIRTLQRLEGVLRVVSRLRVRR
jgi:predicted HAD superfamily phosphohydrolase YqeG